MSKGLPILGLEITWAIYISETEHVGPQHLNMYSVDELLAHAPEDANSIYSDSENKCVDSKVNGNSINAKVLFTT